MAKDMGAGADLEAGESGASDAGEDNANERQPNTFFLPPDFLGGKKYKKGDTITLSVIGEDEDGDTEVSLAGEGEGDEEGWQSDLNKTLSAAGQKPGSSMGGY